MNPLQRRVVELFTEDVNRWGKAAEDIKAILPNTAAPDREQWKAKAETYRARAKELRSVVKQLKTIDRQMADVVRRFENR